MALPKPMELKQFYILLALTSQEQEQEQGHTNNPAPYSASEIHEQIIGDSQLSLYLSYSTLYRLLRELSAAKLVDTLETDRRTLQGIPRYQITAEGRRRLDIAVKDLTYATNIAQARVKNYAIMPK